MSSHLCENSSKYSSVFPEDFWRKWCLWSSYLYLGYYCHKTGQLMTTQKQVFHWTRLLCSCQWVSMPLLSPPDLSLHGLFSRALHTALERCLWRYCKLAPFGAEESRLTFPITLCTVLAWLPCPLQTHRHPVSPSVPFLATTCSFPCLYKNNSHTN